ncbi:Uncharacterized protein TCM_033194 [Theobroma cacao]|uniref:Uncharacterized protein n=1 Tax=Theobroma cacao TaxID=3641 RepID=A0A061FAW6_THECC|nr:Uncharacterized protein TCM_033194 [Theobroma cacao]
MNIMEQSKSCPIREVNGLALCSKLLFLLMFESEFKAMQGQNIPCFFDLRFGGEQICDESPTAMMEGAVDVEKFILGRMFI